MHDDKQDMVSIVIPNYNSEYTIVDTLASVLAQTHTAWECIVVDDCSTDKSPALIETIAKGDDRMRFVRLATPSGGPAHPRNVALDIAHGRYVAFLDSDDVWHPQKLEIQLAAMRQQNAVFCSTTITRFRTMSEITHLRTIPFQMPSTLDNTLVQRIDHAVLLRKNIIPNSSVIAERSVFEHLRFNEDPQFHAIEDFQCWLMAHQTAMLYSIKISPRLLFYRLSPTSLSATKITMIRRHWRLYKHYRIHGKPMPMMQKLAYMATYAFSSITNLMGWKIVNTLDNVSVSASVSMSESIRQFTRNE
jgi:teichuronic acid biosynthesis glycosyltransferase TuaG